jgi:hypothetical protein
MHSRREKGTLESLCAFINHWEYFPEHHRVLWQSVNGRIFSICSEVILNSACAAIYVNLPITVKQLVSFCFQSHNLDDNQVC